MLDRVTVNPESFMPRQPAMIQGNPVQTGWDQQETRTAQAEQRDAVRLDRDNKEAFNAGLSGVLSIADPAERSRQTAALQARTGQGRDALQTLSTEDSRKRGLEDKALVAYASGQTALGDQYALQAGTVIPDAIKNDGAMAGGIKLARDMGYSDPQQAATFAVKFKETHDPKAASDAAGVPKPKQVAVTPNYVPWNVTDPSGNVSTKSFDTRSNTWTDAPFQGSVSKVGSGGGSGGRPLNVQVKREMWLRVHPGDEQGALEYAGGKRTMSAQEASKAAMATVRSLKNEFGEPLYKTEEEVLRATQTFANAILGAQAPSGNLSTVTPNATTAPDPNDVLRGMTDEQLQEWLQQNGGGQ
jgi:hypothetical protein